MNAHEANHLLMELADDLEAGRMVKEDILPEANRLFQFLQSEKKTAESKTKMMIVMQGGLVTGVFADKAIEGLEVLLADYDVEGSSLPLQKDPYGEDIVLEGLAVGHTGSYAEEMLQLEEQDLEQ